MKILVFSPYYYPHLGGVEAYVQELNQQLLAKGMKITVFTTQLPVEEKDFLVKKDNLEIIKFPAFDLVYNYPLPKFWHPEFWRIFRNLFSTEFDAVISHTRFFSTTLLALYFSKKKKTKWIHFEHGADFVQSGNFLIRAVARTYDQTFGKYIFKKADKIVAISNSVKNFILKIYPKCNPEVIYRGFDFEKIKNIQVNSEMAEKYKSQIVIVFIGRLISGKGVADLIMALDKIKKENYQCLIIGEGPEKNNLRQMIESLSLQEKIILLGHKKHQECLAILKIADIFVNPSHTEGLPTTVIEAAVCGKAIIASNVGGTAEIIEENVSGNLFQAKDIPGLANKLETLIKDGEKRKNFGERAKENVLRKFNWEKNIGNFLEIMK